METREHCPHLCYTDIVLDLPMRDGNPFACQSLLDDVIVLDLPMRDGN